MKRVSLDTLAAQWGETEYRKLCRRIADQITAGKIKPVKASGINGKKPALYREYWLTEAQKDYGEWEEELKFSLSPAISPDYYLRNLPVYQQDRSWVLLLSDYLKYQRESLQEWESVNERSFEIWGREKFLTREQGKRILKRCGISPEALHMYPTSEPLAYYSRSREVPQNILILENKDTFFSMRRHLIGGRKEILGVPISTLIYGAGKKILRSFQDFAFCVEPYMNRRENRILYFGDLDYEGIGIYENLAELFCQEHEILPFQKGYQAMLQKCGQADALPETREKQNHRIGTRFFSFFSQPQVKRMRDILEEERYIPQEILSIRDF